MTCTTLTRLHLANNKLSSLRGNFKGLYNLSYLNLRSNQIFYVDGLEELQSLETLHLDNQNIVKSQEMSFDSETLHTLSV